jgi:hypothetical protein
MIDRDMVDPFNAAFNTLSEVQGGLDTSRRAQRLGVFCSNYLLMLIPLLGTPAALSDNI